MHSLTAFLPEVEGMGNRIKTGIAGLDERIEGGFIDGSVNVLSGGPGTGKTIFCLQFLMKGALDGDRGIYISFEENEADLKADGQSIGIPLDKVKGMIRFVYVPISEIGGFVESLKEKIYFFKPKRIVIDSVTVLSMQMETSFEKRKEVYSIMRTLKSMGCTSILTSEVSPGSVMGGDGEGYVHADIQEYLGDSVITLHYAGIGGESDRAIQIVKMRRSNHAKGPIPMTIAKGGVKVVKSKIGK